MGFSFYSKRKSDEALLAGGLGKCGKCGRNLTFDAKNLYYVCIGRKKGKCDQPYLKQERLEGHFRELVLTLEKAAKKSRRLRDLRYQVVAKKNSLLSELEHLDTELARAAKELQTIHETGDDLQFTTELHELKDLDRQRTQSQCWLEANGDILWAIDYLKELAALLDEHPSFIALLLKSVTASDQSITAIEANAPLDHAMHVAFADTNTGIQARIVHDQNLAGLSLNQAIDYLASGHFSLTTIRKPSKKTQQRHEPRSLGESDAEVLPPHLLELFMKSPLSQAKFDRFISPSELDEALEYARQFDKRPSPYKKQPPGSLKLEIGGKEAAAVLKYQIGQLAWLVKNQPPNWQLYSDWETLTLHFIGKIFGWQTQAYSGFAQLCAPLQSPTTPHNLRQTLLDTHQSLEDYLRLLVSYLDS